MLNQDIINRCSPSKHTTRAQYINKHANSSDLRTKRTRYEYYARNSRKAVYDEGGVNSTTTIVAAV